MLGLPAKDCWTVALIALSIIAFLATARWPLHLASPRAVVVCSMGFSLGLMALALVSGLVVLR